MHTHISGLEKLSNSCCSSFPLLSVMEPWNVTIILFSAVAQLNSRFRKATSCSVPAKLKICTSSSQISLSSSVFQFGGWSHMQPEEQPVCACSWQENLILSIVKREHILRTWNELAPKECPHEITSSFKYSTSGSLVMSSIKYLWLPMTVG